MNRHIKRIQQLEKKAKGDRGEFLKLLNAYENRQTGPRGLFDLHAAYERYDREVNPKPYGLGNNLDNNTDILKKIGKQKEILRVKTYAKGYGVRVTKMVGGKRVPRTVNEIKANLAKKKDYLKDPTNHHILSIEYLRNAAKKQGVRVTKNVGGKRVSKNENELLKNLGNMRT
tara:strand:- start:861 stop:1376 length:516 start_codon:yes stop_codon:yes gene_type:complete